MRLREIAVCLLAAMTPMAWARDANPSVPSSCRVLYSMVEQDALHNLNQGLPASGIKDKNGQKWLEKMYKRYPDVCYVAPNRGASIVFFIAATPAVYHGTTVESQTQSTQYSTSGTITNSNGNSADANANTMETSQGYVDVPYEVDYNSFTLTVERLVVDRKTGERRYMALRRFRVDGLYHVVYGFSWGKGKHPITNVMEEAIQWIHDGGLSNPAQSVAE